MNRLLIIATICLLVFGGQGNALAADNPQPFGLQTGHTSYAAAVDLLQSRGWKFQEYEKKQFHEIGPQDPNRGKNTFLLVSPGKLEDIRRMILFFSSDSVLNALLIVIEPNLFESVMEDLDRKYKLVKKHLQGQSYSSDYTHVLWEKGTTYIELQRLSPHYVRLLYVEKLLYENYREFLVKTYESFRRGLVKKDWMKEL
ncbi:MAG: hypothetical protein AMJ54_00360 [Deltaproteobacteria bacterium SG8_13]|nr:MAG: hypothetical protein AMJ54_00360 [Deltaproteobacteria bacterium SG8_13]